MTTEKRVSGWAITVILLWSLYGKPLMMRTSRVHAAGYVLACIIHEISGLMRPGDTLS